MRACFTPINTRSLSSKLHLSYKLLDHTTDAFIELQASSLEEAFLVAAKSVIDLTIDPETVQNKEEKQIFATGKDLRYLLFSWLEELVYMLITEGFAIKNVKLNLESSPEYKISAIAFGEPLDLKKHHFKVEIKAPTFHEMEIKQNGSVTMRYLLDL